MSEALYLVDSSGEAVQNPDLAPGAHDSDWEAAETERIDAVKIAFHASRARRHTGSQEIAEEDEALEDLPTEEFEVVAAESDDPARMERIRVKREERKVMSRQEEADARLRRQSAMDAIQKRLAGRAASMGRLRDQRKRK